MTPKTFPMYYFSENIQLNLEYSGSKFSAPRHVNKNYCQVRTLTSFNTYTKNTSQFNFPVFSISVIMNNIDVV